jgi:hypothetical protein
MFARATTARPRRIWRAPVLALTFPGCAVMLLAAQLPASAIDVSGTPSPVTGNATWFSGLGSPYGGCGLPQADLDSQNFLALNVQNSPGVYSNLPRPIPAADASEIGMFDNGLNCGRWVQVTIGNYCTGVNDGAPNEPFCRNGSWVSDQYNGATLDFVPAGCTDGCPTPYTPISYTTSGGGGGGGTSTPSPNPSPSVSPSPTSTSQPASGCALTSTVTNSWPGGYQLQLTVSNQGSAASRAWMAGFSTTWGMVVTGSNQSCPG